MQQHILISVGTFFVTVGVISFLIPAIPHWGTFILLLGGAIAVVKGGWFTTA